MFNLFKNSFLELKKTKTIVICGFLLATSLVLNTQSVKIGNLTIITFSFIANSICGFLFGPIPASILGGLTDVLTHVINPKGEYFPGYTLNAFLGGLFYGMFLYKKMYKIENIKALISRIVACKVSISLVINLFLGTLWTSIYYGKAFMVLLVPRVSKELILIPIHCFIMYVILKFINKVYYQLNLDK